MQIANIITGKNRKMGAVSSIVVGILGAFIGAGIMGILGIAVPQGFSLMGLMVAVAGLVIMIMAMSLI